MNNKPHHGNHWMPILYAEYYGIFKPIAEKCGYALTLHGTMCRDLDLVAIPWIEKPSTHKELISELRNAMGYYKTGDIPWDSMEQKLHGRIAYTIATGAGGYLDLSIMPIKGD